MFTPVGFSCYFSQASAVPRQLYFQRIEEQWNPTSQKEAFVSTSGSGSNVAWAERWKVTVQPLPLLS